MDDYLKEALEIARAQASVRVMSEEEITSFIQKVAAGIRTVAEGEMPVELDSADMQQDARKSIKEKSVTCLECGKTFKILTKRHLAMHGMDAAAYREKWGFKKDTPLVCKALQRERRRKMKDMKLWEKPSQDPIAQIPAARRVFLWPERRPVPRGGRSVGPFAGPAAIFPSPGGARAPAPAPLSQRRFPQGSIA